jgi:hypothetical protein
VSLNQNPIFLTQKRLVHRSGVLAAILIAALIGLSLLSGLIAYLADPRGFDFRSPQEAGKMFYGWVIGVEILVLVIGGFSRISSTLANERKAGLWDSNRLTPLKPLDLVSGYWFGSPLREFYMGVVLAVIGLVIVLLGRLSFTFWLETQILVASTALFFGLLGVLMGLTFTRPQGLLILLVIFIVYPFSFIAPSRMLFNFFLPIYGIAHLFQDSVDPDDDWNRTPELFGLHLDPVLLSISLQLIIGIFLWRAAGRKTSNPFQSPLLRREAVVLFGILVFIQHGLLWGLWRGQFPILVHSQNKFYDSESMLPMVQGGTMLLGLVVLAFASPQPERVRVESLRLGFKNLGAIFPRSAVWLALVLTTVAAVALLMQCFLSIAYTWKAYVAAAGNLLEFFLIISFLLEYCRLRFRRRALGFMALWLFVLCILPFILGGVFTTSALGDMSLLSPGIKALAEQFTNNTPGPHGLDLHVADENVLLGMVGAHFCIAFLCFLLWRREWMRLLSKTSSAAPAQ